MIDLGTVDLGSTLYIPISTNTGSGGTIGFSSTPVVGDFEVYKDGTTTRADTTGYSFTEGVNSKTGLHVFTLNMTSNPASYWELGEKYLVGFTPTATVDGQTVEAWVAEFKIETSAEQKLKASAEGILPGVASGTPTTTSNDSDISGFEDDELIGRTIVFTAGTAHGCAAIITDYTNAGGVISYIDGIATASVAGDTFIVV
jgi:hypothetical protein|tara:strand:- start:184 stop:786 length:603 start_codon:yes stop_codon:yes gene_type:complete